MRRVAILSGPSGSGKSTFGRALAGRLGVPYVETDALVHGPGWVERSPEAVRAALDPTLTLDGWVIDNPYRRLVGDVVIDAADTLVWLDLPMRVWVPRLLYRTLRRLARDELLWNGNRESWRQAFTGREGLIPVAFRAHRDTRRRYPARYAGYPLVRLRSTGEVRAFLAAVGASERATIAR
jgi:adenylate kinase family enzyme